MLTEQQARAMLRVGFEHGFRGYPVLFADNGKVTVVEETDFRVTMWEFEADGAVLVRDYVRDGNMHISAVI